MNKSIDNHRINLSNKLYPVFYGLSADLIFFIAINTLFLTEVKGLSSSNINFITTIGMLTAIFFYLFSHKIIKKIGNLSSIKLGTLLILISTLLFTFSTNLLFFALAEILYEISFVFKSMDTIVLNNNLIYENKENDFVKIKSKATTIYSITTLIASLFAGILFNINPYIPMIICILICLNNFIMSHYIYEIKSNTKEENKRIKFKFNRTILATIIIYGLLYGTVVVCQTNDKLFMQYKLEEFLEVNNIAIIISIVLFLSRISRLLSNLFFVKIYSRLKNRILYLINFALIISVLLFIFGKLIPFALYGCIMMAIGFILLLALRDPIEIVLSNILLENASKENKEQAILYFQFARRLVVFILSLIATIILTKYELLHLYLIILILTIIYLFIVLKLFNLIRCRK